MAEEAPEVHGQGSSGDAIGKIQPSSVGGGGREVFGRRGDNQKCQMQRSSGTSKCKGLCSWNSGASSKQRKKKTRISMWRRAGSDLMGSSSERLVEGQIFGD